MLVGARQLIKESWTLYKNNFVLFVKITVWLLVPAIILSLLPVFNLNPALLFPANIFLSLVSFFLGLFISVALVLVISGLLKKEKIGLTPIYNLSYSKIFSYFWVSLLAGLAVFGGTLLLIIPGIIFSVWFSFSVYILILEDVRGTQALSQSRELTRNYFWPTLWRWIAPYFVYGLVMTIILIIPIYLIGLALGHPMAGFAEVTPWWSSLISNVISILTVPLFTIIGVLLYNSLKKEKTSTAKQ